MANVESGVRTASVWTSTASAVQSTQKVAAAVSNAAGRPNIANEVAAASKANDASVVSSLPSTVDAGLRQLLDKSATSAQIVSRDLKINVDDNSGRYVVSVLDPETDEVIRQFPPEGALNMIATINRIMEDGKGSLLNEQT